MIDLPKRRIQRLLMIPMINSAISGLIKNPWYRKNTSTQFLYACNTQKNVTINNQLWRIAILSNSLIVELIECRWRFTLIIVNNLFWLITGIILIKHVSSSYVVQRQTIVSNVLHLKRNTKSNGKPQHFFLESEALSAQKKWKNKWSACRSWRNSPADMFMMRVHIIKLLFSCPLHFSRRVFSLKVLHTCCFTDIVQHDRAKVFFYNFFITFCWCLVGKKSDRSISLWSVRSF